MISIPVGVYDAVYFISHCESSLFFVSLYFRFVTDVELKDNIQ